MDKNIMNAPELEQEEALMEIEVADAEPLLENPTPENVALDDPMTESVAPEDVIADPEPEAPEGEVAGTDPVRVLAKALTKLDQAGRKATPQQQMIINHLATRMSEDFSLAEDFAQDHKTFEKCWKFIYDSAREQATDHCAMVEDHVVFEWSECYIHRDDLAFEQEKAKKEAELKAKREKEAEARKAKAKKKRAAKTGEVQGQKDMLSELKGTNTAPVTKNDPVIKQPAGAITGQTDLFGLLAGGDAGC